MFVIAAAAAEKCVKWRQTGRCKSNGPRESKYDALCMTMIGTGRSGFCECSRAVNDGSTPITLRLSFDCGHLPFSCNKKCAKAATAKMLAADGTAPRRREKPVDWGWTRAQVRRRNRRKQGGKETPLPRSCDMLLRNLSVSDDATTAMASACGRLNTSARLAFFQRLARLASVEWPPPSPPPRPRTPPPPSPPPLPRAPPPQRHLSPQEERRRCGLNATNSSYHAAPPPTPNSSTDAIVTIAVGEASAAGAVVLGAQLERVGSTSIWIALVEEVSNRTAAALVGVGWRVQPLPIWEGAIGWSAPKCVGCKPCMAKYSASALRAFMAKLALFGFTSLRSIVLLDSDVVLFANPDRLHDIDAGVAAAAAHRTRACAPQRRRRKSADAVALCEVPDIGGNPNAGVVLIRPSQKEMDGIRELVATRKECPKYPEQGILHLYFGPRLRYFDRWWNAREGDRDSGAGARGSPLALERVKIYHFVGLCPKPHLHACKWDRLRTDWCERGSIDFAYQRWHCDLLGLREAGRRAPGLTCGSRSTRRSLTNRAS